MAYEIDFLAVGDGDKSGDAIAIRYGEPGAFRVMIVDGGDKAAGARLVDHVLTVYGTNRVDWVVNTHPDIDHASGLEVVLNELNVGELWLHRPWLYSQEIYAWRQDRRFTPKGFHERLCEDLSYAFQLDELATRRGIRVCEPYQGARIGDRFWVASPSKEWYGEIVHHFDKTPDSRAPVPSWTSQSRTPSLGLPAGASAASGVTAETSRLLDYMPNVRAAVQGLGISRPSSRDGVIGALARSRGLLDEPTWMENSPTIRAAAMGLGLLETARPRGDALGLMALGGGLLDQSVPSAPIETWDRETLEHAPQTSFDNESSVVLYGALDDGILLTGDAGVLALNRAIDWLEAHQIRPTDHVRVVQVPHHGSRHNVDPPTLDRMLGPIRPAGHRNGTIAIASVGATSDHPRKVVTNAFIRRGVSVYLAKGRGLRHARGMGDRLNWTPMREVQFSEYVEA